VQNFLADMPEFAEDDLVSIVGEVRNDKDFYVSVVYCSKVVDKADVGYHKILSLHTFMNLTQKNKVVVAPIDFSPVKSSAPTQATQDFKPSDGPIRDQIKKFCDTSDEVGKTLADVLAHFKGADEADVKKHVEDMKDSGEFYETIDDNHFKAI